MDRSVRPPFPKYPTYPGFTPTPRFVPGAAPGLPPPPAAYAGFGPRPMTGNPALSQAQVLTPPDLLSGGPTAGVPEYAGDLAGLEAPPTYPGQATTMLERWAKREYNTTPDQLMQDDDEQMTSLQEWMIARCKEAEHQWTGRTDRMKSDQAAYALHDRPGALGHDDKSRDEKKAQGIIDIVLPDHHIVPNKMVDMLVAPDLRYSLPAHRLVDTTSVQLVENFLTHCWNTLNKRAGRGAYGDFRRRIAHHLVLRGWSCILAMPDSSDDTLPYRVKCCDPINVFPAANGDGVWIRTFYKYDLSVSAALEEYPEAETMLADFEETDMISCIAYYDVKWHCIALTGQSSNKSGRGAARPTSTILMPPRPHGVTDLNNKPKLPWEIVLALGDLSGDDGQTSGEPDTTLVGPGILYALREMVDVMSMVFSMLLSQVARSTNPPTVDYIPRGAAIPAPLSQEPGASNYREGEGKVQILDTAPNPGNLQPVMQIGTDRINKAGMPPVTYGEGGSIQSGYGVGRLIDPALDRLTGFKQGLIYAIGGVMQRILEITGTITAQTHQSLPMATRQGLLGQSRGADFDPKLVMVSGAEVDVLFGEVTAQDRAALVAWLMPAVQANVIDRHTAREELGYQDPLLMAQRVAMQDVMENPAAALLLGKMSAFGSDEELLMFLNQLNQQLQAQQAAQGGPPGGPGGPQNTPSPAGQSGPQGVPPNMQPGTAASGGAGNPPPAQNPAAQAGRAMNRGRAMGSGGSQPAPRPPGMGM